MIVKTYRTIKKLLKKNKFPGIFGGKYGFSPYMGCEHDCKYCDGRYEKYNFEGDFRKEIKIKSNVPDLLEKELPKIRETGFINLQSGISDVYQPVEKEEKLTMRCAEIISEYNFPVSLITKSSLILRDIDYWEKVNKNSRFILFISLVYADDKHRKILEPDAASVEERLDVLREFRRRNIPVGISGMPFIPGICDDTDNIRKLVEKVTGIGVDFFWPGLLTLKEGRQKDYFIEMISCNYPELQVFYNDLYSNKSTYGEPKRQFCRDKFGEIQKILKEYHIPQRPPHQAFKGVIPKYDEILILLDDMRDLYSAEGTDTKRLSQAFYRYFKWLDGEKKPYNRRRTWSYSDLDEKIIYMVESGEINQVLSNKKLAEFLKSVIFNNKVFDYNTLKLVNEKDLCEKS